MADIRAEETDEEYEYHDDKQAHPKQSSSAVPKPAGASSSTATSSKGKETFGQKMKDKLTGSTHAEREKDRAKRAEDEQKAYQRHLALRQAMNPPLRPASRSSSERMPRDMIYILSRQSSRVVDMACGQLTGSTTHTRLDRTRTRMRGS